MKSSPPQPDPASARLIEKVTDAVERDPAFSESEISALHDLTRAWQGATLMWRFGKWGITALALIATLVGSLAVIKAAAKEWFR